MELGIYFVYIAIYIGLVTTTFYFLSFMSGRKKEKLFYSDDELPKVSVLIPAYNEEKSIEETIRSILNSDYPDFEVIVIDDGSKDKTYELAKKFVSSKVRVFTKKNGGKGTALNFGIKKAKSDIIFTMDADTFVDSQSMRRMVRHFKEPSVMSVTPTMVIYKPKSILQRIQYVEYLMNVFLKKAFASIGAIYNAPGAFSAYRKSFFEKYGGYDVGNITEDLEMALRIQSKGYSTDSCPEALAYTLAPSKFKPLLIQRRRWYYGLIKNLLNYRHIFGRKYGDLGMFVLPAIVISIILSIIITFFLFFKVISEVKKSYFYLYHSGFDFKSILNLDLFFVERFLFLFFTNPVIIFIIVFLFILIGLFYYARRKVGKLSGMFISFPLFFAFFSILFAFWWVVSIIYAIFYKEIKWR